MGEKRKRSRTVWWILFLLVFACGFGNSLSVQAKNNVIKVAVMGYPNFICMQEDGTVYGYAYEYLEEISEHTNWEYEYIPMNLSEAMEAIEKGEIDIVPGIQMTDARAEICDFSEYYMASGESVFCTDLEENAYYFNDYEAFDGMRVGNLKGSVRSAQVKAILREYGSEPEIIEYETDELAKKALEEGEIDAILMSAIRCEEQYKIIGRFSAAPIYFGLNKDRPELKKMLDKAQKEIRIYDPFFEMKLEEKYYSEIAVQIAIDKEERAFLDTCGTIKVQVFGDMAPVEYYDERTGEFQGLTVAMLERIEEYTGLQFEYILREEELQEGCLVSTWSCNKDATRNYPYVVTEGYFDNSISAVVRKDSSGYETGGIGAVRRGTVMLKRRAEGQGYEEMQLYNTTEECIRAVSKGKADMTFVPTYCIDQYKHEPYFDKIYCYTVPGSMESFGIGIPADMDHRLERILNKGIAMMSKSEKNTILLESLSIKGNTFTFFDFVREHLFVFFGIITVFLSIFLVVFYHQERKAKYLNTVLEGEIARADAALKQIELASAARQDFFSRINHDMRTPMNAVIGMARIGLKSTNLVEAKGYFQTITETGKYLLALINDTLEISRLESDNIEIRTEYCVMDVLVKNVKNMISGLAGAKNIHFNCFVEQDAGYLIETDKLRIQQIMINLLNNAVKFTENDGNVELKVRLQKLNEKDMSVEILVQDDGVGISPEFQERMFEPFFQEKGFGTGEKGTGLGLYIVHCIVEKMGGKIVCQSEKGEGTRFVVSFITSYKQYDKEEEVTKSGLNLDMIRAALEGKRVLVCEDNDINAVIMENVLKEVGIQVEIAVDGVQALDKISSAEEGAYDAIFMDVHMPNMDGLEATERIRQMNSPKKSQIPIIAMTASGFEEDIRRCLKAGMDEHLSKPVEPEKVYESLMRYLENVRQII